MVGWDGTISFRLLRTHVLMTDDRDAQVLKLADVASGVIPLQTSSNAMLAAVLWRHQWLPFVRPVFEGRFPGVV